MRDLTVMLAINYYRKADARRFDTVFKFIQILYSTTVQFREISFKRSKTSNWRFSIFYAFPFDYGPRRIHDVHDDAVADTVG